MNQTKFLQQEAAITAILEEKPQTRDDDCILYAEVLRRHYPDAFSLGLIEAFVNHATLKIPSYESVTRVRRKVQAQREDLTSERARRKRAKEAEIYREYAAAKAAKK